MSSANDLEARLTRARELLEQDQPNTAEQTLREILKSSPEEPKALRMLGYTFLQQRRNDKAVETFERVVAATNRNPVSILDLARALSQSGDLERAASVLEDVLKDVKTLSPGWYLLGDIYVELRSFEKAVHAFGQAAANDPFRVQIDQVKRSMQENDFAKAERVSRHILEQDPLHVEALASMEVLAMAREDWIEAERLFTQIKERTRYWPLLLMGMSQLFLMTDRASAAAETLATLVEINPELILAWNMLGTANEMLLRNEAAIAAFERSLELEPNQPRAYVSIGNIQRVIGNREASEKAFTDALKFVGMNGEAYWGLSNLKNYDFTDQQVADMRASVDRDANSLHNAAPMFFALAMAQEGRGDYAAAFAYYCKGNEIQRQASGFSPALYAEEIDRLQNVFNADLLARTSNEDAAPIFIVGMPRTGSTLVEQILASHSNVDATMELPFVESYVREFQALAAELGPYPESMANVDASEMGRFAERYLESASTYRRGAPRFLDKMPNNFVHIGLIHRMFPHARFIDIQRNPMDTGLSVFKQRFAIGQPFSYSLEDIGAYYVGYRRLMSHWLLELPDDVMTVRYEDLVSDPETEIRRLLDFCGLDFEAACLAPHETKRSIRTPSSEQVREPITTARIGYWKNFEAHLRPLQSTLTDAIAAYESGTDAG